MPLLKYFQLYSYGIDHIKRSEKEHYFLGWNQKIQNVTVISYIVMCISMDGTLPLGETLTEKIIDITLVLLKVYNRVPKMGADE